MDDRVSRPWRNRLLQVVAIAVLAACGGGGGGGIGGSGADISNTVLSSQDTSQPAAANPACTVVQANVMVDAVRIRQAANPKEVTHALPQPRPIDLLDPGTGILEALQLAPLTQDALDVRLSVASGSTVRLDDGSTAPLRVPGTLQLEGDFHLAAGMVADLVVQGFDRCNAIHAAGQSGQFVLNGRVPVIVRALPFVIGQEQMVQGSLRPVPGDGYATVSSPAAGSFTIQRFDAYGDALGSAITLSIGGMSPSVTPLANGGVMATWLGPATDPEVPLGQHFPLMVQRFAADGTPQGAPTQVALTQPFISRGEIPSILPQAAALADGGAALVWVQLESGGFLRVYMERFAADGSSVNGAQQVNITASGGLPNVVGLTGNRVLVAWGFGELFARVFQADGSAGAEQQIVSTAASLLGPPQLAALADGGAAVAWDASNVTGSSQIDMVRLAPDGSPTGSPQILAEGSAASIAGLADGGFVVAWFTPNSVQAQRFGADGSPQGPVMQVNLTSTPVPGPSVVALPWGGFLIGWPILSDGNAMRLFDAAGLLAD